MLKASRIKLFFLKNFLSARKGTVARNIRLKSWDEIKTVGLLYTVPDEPEYVKFVSFVGWLQSQRKEIKALGLLKTNNIPHYCFPRITFDYFSPKNISWLGKPGGEKVHDFIYNEFDLVVNLELSGNPIFNYIIRESKARLKAGTYTEDLTHLYDLMISDTAVSNSETLMEHIIVYLNVLGDQAAAATDPPEEISNQKKKKQKRK